MQATKLRAEIEEKAKLYLQIDEIPQDNHQSSRNRKGMKYSTAANNVEGL